MKQYILSEQLHKEILAFISQYPYREVAKFIHALSQLPVEEREEKSKDK